MTGVQIHEQFNRQHSGHWKTSEAASALVLVGSPGAGNLSPRDRKEFSRPALDSALFVGPLADFPAFDSGAIYAALPRVAGLHAVPHDLRRPLRRLDLKNGSVLWLCLDLYEPF